MVMVRSTQAYVSSFFGSGAPPLGGGTHCLYAYTFQREAKFHMHLQLSMQSEDVNPNLCV